MALIIGMIFTLGCAEEGAETQQETAEAKKVEEAPKVVQPTPPGSVRASHILVSHSGAPRTGATRTQAEAKELADEILAKVEAGESFEELAKTYSDCPSAEKGGDLGFFQKGRMVKPFEDATYALEVGNTSGVVETQFGYHIIKRTQ
jgi:peptidyl-prolyl cis-trans isomerase C/peptidyl-prolyl cis-trans isomerase SurA